MYGSRPNLKRLLYLVLLLILIAMAAPSYAQSVPRPKQAYPGFYSQPPRFQIFTAPKPYGGLMMVDTKTGDSWQRVIVNTEKGITIRWIRLPKDQPLKENETILWQ